MDGATPALIAAIDLLHLPSHVRLLRKHPLPDGVLILLRVVAGDEDAIADAVAATGRPCDTVREAAAFFIEQILLHAEAEPYRVLGAKPDASDAELRRNMALLVRWLHPDRDSLGERSIFAARVTLAWDRLKTRERRAAHDAVRRKVPAKPSRVRKSGGTRVQSSKQPAAARHRNTAPYRLNAASGRLLDGSHRSGVLRRLLLFWLGGAKP
jgi:hypothetical protein